MGDQHISGRPSTRAQGAGSPVSAGTQRTVSAGTQRTVSAGTQRTVSAGRQRTVSAAPEFPCWTNPDLFFAEDPQDVARAKALCRRCPVQAGCLAGALQRAEPWGIWGGELVQRGVVIADKRPRGRPRKADVAA